MDEIQNKDQNIPGKVKSQKERYKDIDDQSFTQDATLSMKLSLWYYWHAFIALLAVIWGSVHVLSMIPEKGLRIYDLFGRPAVSKTSSKMWLNLLNTKVPEDLVIYPLYGLIGLSIALIIYYYLKVKTTKYNLNFRWLEVIEGVFSQETNQIDLFTIKDEVLERPFLFRILGISRLIIHSSDKTTPLLKIPGVRAEDATEFLHYIRTNAYGSFTEYRVAKDRRQRNEKGPKRPQDDDVVVGGDEENNE